MRETIRSHNPVSHLLCDRPSMETREAGSEEDEMKRLQGAKPWVGGEQGDNVTVKKEVCAGHSGTCL